MKTFITKKIALSLLVVAAAVGTSKAQSAYDDQQYSYNTQPGQYQQPISNDQQGFYYYPDANVYYDISCNRYIYNNRGSWLSVNILPSGICLTNAPRYEVYHRGPQVWLDNAIHVRNYYRPAYNRQPVVANNNYRHNDFGKRDVVRRDDFRKDNYKRDQHFDGNHDRGGHRW